MTTRLDLIHYFLTWTKLSELGRRTALNFYENLFRLLAISPPSRSRICSAGSQRCIATCLKFRELCYCFSFAGSAAWNILPDSLQDIRDHNSFKRHLKTLLFNVYIRDINCFIGHALSITNGVSDALEKTILNFENSGCAQVFPPSS